MDACKTGYHVLILGMSHSKFIWRQIEGASAGQRYMLFLPGQPGSTKVEATRDVYVYKECGQPLSGFGMIRLLVASTKGL